MTLDDLERLAREALDPRPMSADLDDEPIGREARLARGCLTLIRIVRRATLSEQDAVAVISLKERP